MSVGMIPGRFVLPMRMPAFAARNRPASSAPAPRVSPFTSNAKGDLRVEDSFIAASTAAPSPSANRRSSTRPHHLVRRLQRPQLLRKIRRQVPRADAQNISLQHRHVRHRLRGH